MDTSLTKYDSFDDFAKNKKTRGESRKDYYQYLVRPDGSPLKAQDCLLLDLCIQWTRGGKVCTSTYKWLLKNKFSSYKSKKTVSRTFVNISLYIKSQFHNSQVINNTTKKDKIRIERDDDFDQKLLDIIQSNSKKGVDKIVHRGRQNCPPRVDKIVHPYTYKKENNLKKTYKDKDIITKTEHVASDDKNVSSANPILFNDFGFDDSMILEAISRSEKPKYKVEDVRAALESILQNSPTKKLYGGKQGFIKYIIKLINAQKDYKQDKVKSMAQRVKERKQLELERSNQSFKSIEEYYKHGR